MKGGPELLLFVILTGVFLENSSVAVAHKDVETPTTCYCVIADGVEMTDPSLCSKCSSHKSLMHFANANMFARSNTIFYFTPGNHTLNMRVNVSRNSHALAGIFLIGISSAGNDSNDYCTVRENPVAIIQCTKGGFHFKNVSKLTIVGLQFRSCGLTVNISSYVYSAAIILESVWNLTMCSVDILSPNGWGLVVFPLYGHSLVKNTEFDSGHGVEDYIGGNMIIVYNSTKPNFVPGSISLTISHSSFKNGRSCPATNCSGAYGAGLHVFFKTTSNVRIRILVDHANFSGNVGKHGGNTAVVYEDGAWSSSIVFVDCYFLNGRADVGGGIYITMVSNNATLQATFVTINVTRCHISNNVAEVVGAGAYLQLHENHLMRSVVAIIFDHCLFDNNYNHISNHSRGGTAVNAIIFLVPGSIPHHSPQYNLGFISCNFTRNRGQATLDDSVGSGTLYTEEISHVMLRDCRFEYNNCSAITAIHSNLLMEGEIVLRRNWAYNGGGMVLCANSMIYFNLSTKAELLIEDCHADNYGGGIYAEFECSQAIPPCFFQVKYNTSKKLIHLHNNTANNSGNAVYGGAVDYCYMYGEYVRNINKTRVFDNTFDIVPSNQNSISSNPIKVCFCSSGAPNCGRSTFWNYTRPVYPGGSLSVTVVVVGQKDGPVPGLVVAKSEDEEVRIVRKSNLINSTCTEINYTIFSTSDEERQVRFDFTVENIEFKNAIIDSGVKATLPVQIANCPYGFSVSNSSGECWCNSWVSSLKGATCNISTNSIQRERNSTWWLGRSQNQSIYTEFCPFDYCVTKKIDISVTESDFEDSQCANNRSGILCGECSGNFSSVLGSNSCLPCHGQYSTLRVVGLIVLFALLGIVFVFMVGVLDMTVSEGTLNAIVFYMNVVRVNTDIFFYSPSKLNNILKMFVIWMNLDWGVEICFYSGMGTVGKTALLFVFPMYLCLLSGLIIYFSQKSSKITTMFGKNVIKILATVIFHFYAKILRVIINILRLSNKEYPKEPGDTTDVRYVWTVDGNIPYLERRHIALVTVALAIVAVTLPYTLALLFIQCVRKKSNMKVFFWVNKLKPFFDAYTGPYKDKYHFWTGFLLVVRIAMFTAIAVSTSKGPILNLSLILCSTAVLFVLIQPGIYKSWVLNIMEAFTYANLIMLAALTTYDLRFNYTNNIPIVLCVGSMFLLFCGIVLYHTLKKLSVTRRWGLIKVWLLDRRWPWMKRKQIRSLILPYVDPDNDEDLSDGELDPILHNAPPVARYDEYREPLIETNRNS